jgi:hypothetical protein
MTNYFIIGQQKLRAIILGLSLLVGVAPATAQDTIRQYLSGTDGEHTVPWDFFCSGGRNSGVWTNIAVPSCWELQGFGKFRSWCPKARISLLADGTALFHPPVFI